MRRITPLHSDHAQALFLSERSRRQAICGSLMAEVSLDRWRPLPTRLILFLGAASAWQAPMAEWPFVNHEPPLLMVPEKADMTAPSDRIDMHRHDH